MNRYAVDNTPIGYANWSARQRRKWDAYRFPWEQGAADAVGNWTTLINAKRGDEQMQAMKPTTKPTTNGKRRPQYDRQKVLRAYDIVMIEQRTAADAAAETGLPKQAIPALVGAEMRRRRTQMGVELPPTRRELAANGKPVPRPTTTSSAPTQPDKPAQVTHPLLHPTLLAHLSSPDVRAYLHEEAEIQDAIRVLVVASSQRSGVSHT